ncbi:hypothetical protein [Luteimonas sp. A478]
MNAFRLLIPACLLLAACQAQTPPPAASVEPAPDPAREAALAADGDIVASYACAEGNQVELVREGRVARLALSDGRIIRLGEMAGSQPRTWSDVGLRFIIDGDFVELSQSNGERNLACEPAG